MEIYQVILICSLTAFTAGIVCFFIGRTAESYTWLKFLRENETPVEDGRSAYSIVEVVIDYHDGKITGLEIDYNPVKLFWGIRRK